MTGSSTAALRLRFILVLVIVLGGAIAATTWRAEHVIEQVMLDRSKHEVTQFLMSIEQQAQRQGGLLEADAMQILLSDTMRDKREALGFSIEQLYAYRPDGTVYAWIGDKQKPRPMDGHYGKVLSQDTPYMGDEIEVEVDRISGVKEHFTDIIVPLHRNGEAVAGLEAEINLDATMRQIKSLDDAYEREVMIAGIVAMLLALVLGWIAVPRRA